MTPFRIEDCLPPDRSWQPASGGESGSLLFRSADGLLYAKCGPTAAAADLAAERERVAWLAGQGLPGAEVVGWSEGDEAVCLVTTTVPGVPASELAPASMLAAWPSVIAAVRRLHDLPVATCPFDRGLASLFPQAERVVAGGWVRNSWLRPEQRGRPHPALLSELRTELPGRLEQEAADLVVCHGDACLPNFLVDPVSLACTGFIDLGRLGTGDRHVDLALLWANLSDHAGAAEHTAAARVLTEVYGPGLVDPGRLRFYLYLDPLTWLPVTPAAPDRHGPAPDS